MSNRSKGGLTILHERMLGDLKYSRLKFFQTSGIEVPNFDYRNKTALPKVTGRYIEPSKIQTTGTTRLKEGLKIKIIPRTYS